MNTIEPARCPKCGAILLANTPAEQCARCLLSVAADALEEEDMAPSGIAPGQRVHYFGDYELLEVIGQGGMGKVWKARQVSLNRIVALKMIHAGRFAGPDEVARFRREAEAAASLDHPNIVPIHEVGEQEGQHYFSMKVVQGTTLAERITCSARQFGSTGCQPVPSGDPPDGIVNALGNKRSEPPDVGYYTLREAAALVAKVARAVHHAHQRGIMHRDLKPANILLDAKGEPHLTDFGLARVIGSSAGLTGSGGILGSLGYMAPEQALGRPKDLTTGVDIYALGCILYELLTGQVPQPADTPEQALHKLATELIPRPRSRNRSINRDLETICLKCLEKEPERRYASAAAIAEDLERWLRSEPITARPIGPVERTMKWVRRHPLKLALAGAILLAIAAPLLVIAYYVIRELPYRATVHQILDDDLHGVFNLEIYDARGERCTLNFTRNHFTGNPGKIMRLVFTNVPPEWLPRLRVRIHADQAGRPDPARSPILTNGQPFRLKVGSFFDRAFYCAEVGWAASNLTVVAPEARILLKPAEP